MVQVQLSLTNYILMKNQITVALKVSILAVVLSFGLSYAIAWTAPTAPPPTGNVSAPINTGSADQTKAGDLCTSKGGTIKCLSAAQIAVPVPVVEFTATPGIIQSGQSTTLSWSVTDATTCTASGSWTGSKATFGSEASSALSGAGGPISYTFTLSCAGAGGTTLQSATVQVLAPFTITYTNGAGNWVSIPSGVTVVKFTGSGGNGGSAYNPGGAGGTTASGNGAGAGGKGYLISPVDGSGSSGTVGRGGAGGGSAIPGGAGGTALQGGSNASGGGKGGYSGLVPGSAYGGWGSLNGGGGGAYAYAEPSTIILYLGGGGGGSGTANSYGGGGGGGYGGGGAGGIYDLDGLYRQGGGGGGGGSYSNANLSAPSPSGRSISLSTIGFPSQIYLGTGAGGSGDYGSGTGGTITMSW